MPNFELANTSIAVVIYSQQEELQSKIVKWIHKPRTYNDQAQSSFVQAINRYAEDAIENIISFVDLSKKKALRDITIKRDRDIACLKLKPSLIAKSFSCGSLGGLAAAQIATQVTVAMAIASCATPVGWIGGTGIAGIYYSFDKRFQEDEIYSKALLEIEKTDRVAEKILSSLELGRSKIENSRLNRFNEYLNDKNDTLNAQLAGIGRDFNVARSQIDQLNNDLAGERAQITTLQTTQANLQNHNDNLNAQLDTTRSRITSLEGFQTTANSQLTAADGNIINLEQANQNLRRDLATNQTNLTNTTARIDELQRQNASNLATVQQMTRDLINEIRVEFEGRERVTATKQIVERGIEKAIRREQEEKILDLSVSLAKKSTAFEVLQSEHDQLADQIGHKFDVMTQAMSCNPIESSVSELLRSNDQHDVSDLDSENNGDFIEVSQDM